ncbi:uncharacterized protein LOC112549121, partial [Alligator sinensis]|uniref:Uncharacterized protein LOC112549121 n=1 Tax=Alligator sinensis TaxID=38654 RepID=A0A3Q0FWJ4_ALLSI
RRAAEERLGPGCQAGLSPPSAPVPGGASHRTGAVIGASLGLAVAAGAAAATAFYCWRRRKGGKPPYTISKVKGPKQCLLGQEVTLRCCMEGTFPEDTAVTWERVQGEDGTATEPHGDTADPERLPLLRALPPGWTATQERSATGLTASLTFTAAVQDDGARVRCCFHHGAKRIREQRESREIRVRGECGRAPRHRGQSGELPDGAGGRP